MIKSEFVLKIYIFADVFVNHLRRNCFYLHIIEMKKLLLSILLLSVFCANAQKKFTPHTTLGINGGVCASQIYFSPTISQTPAIGRTGGLVFKHVQEPHLGIQLELNYSERGWEENYDSVNSYSRKLCYVEFPFMSHFEFGKRGTKLFLNAGASLSYLLSDADTISLTNELYRQSYDGRNVDSKMEMGLCGGLGVSQSTPIGDFQLECRFHQGVNNLFKKDTGFSFSTNQVLSVRLAYLIRLK